MNDDSFIKIENLDMPCDNFIDLNLDNNVNYSRGVINFVFLLGILVTSFMWILLIFFRK